MQYMIDLAFPVSNMQEWERGNERVRVAVGDLGEEVSAGTGFGFRDMQFSFSDGNRRSFALECLKALQTAGLMTFEYLNTYEADEEGYQLDENGRRAE